MAGALTYAVVNGAVLVGLWLAAMALRPNMPWRRVHAVVGIMVLLTLVFDSLLVLMDTFRYNHSLVSGWLLGLAPIEDAAYAIAAGILVPALWEWLGRRNRPDLHR